jgi:hypothetical protein
VASIDVRETDGLGSADLANTGISNALVEDQMLRALGELDSTIGVGRSLHSHDRKELTKNLEKASSSRPSHLWTRGPGVYFLNRQLWQFLHQVHIPQALRFASD